MAIRPNVFSLATATGTTLYTGPVYLRGISVRENAGSPAAAVLNVYNNTADSGTVVYRLQLAASGATTVIFNTPILLQTGARVQAASGSVEGTLYLD